MIKFVKGALLAAGICLALQGVAQAQRSGDINADENKAQGKISKEGTKFTKKKAGCIKKCTKTHAAAADDVADCLPPYPLVDATAEACINDPIKGAEPKFEAGINKACLTDVPECYGSDCPTYAGNQSGAVEAQIDPFGGLVYCTGANVVTVDEQKCMGKTSDLLVKFVGARAKCYDKCVAGAFKAKWNITDCYPGPPADPLVNKLGDCLAKAATKKDASIAKLVLCPACYLPDTVTYANALAGAAEVAVDATTQGVYCESPSGAFLN